MSSVTRWASRTLIDSQQQPRVVASKARDTATSAVSQEAPVGANSEAISEFLLHRQSVVRFVRDAIASAVDRQKENVDKHGRKNKQVFALGDRVLLSTECTNPELVTNLGAKNSRRD